MLLLKMFTTGWFDLRNTQTKPTVNTRSKVLPAVNTRKHQTKPAVNTRKHQTKPCLL